MTTQIDFIADRRGYRYKSFWRNRYLLPLFEFGPQLRKRGFKIRFFNLDELPKQTKASVLCLDSHHFSYQEGLLSNPHLELLENFRQKYELILWFDLKDSTGTTQFEVLPFVDKYCKKQFLRDKSLYLRPIYYGRIFLEFIHERYDISDSKPDQTGVLLEQRYLHKLFLGWSLAYEDFRVRTSFSKYIDLFHPSRIPPFFDDQDRTVDLQARYGGKITSEVAAFQRKEYIRRLQGIQGFKIRMGRISYAEYKKELRRTRAVLSPFGWGELCSRDFEAMQNSCALIKPSLAHLETWPPIFIEGQTYIDLPWEFGGAITKLEETLRNKSLLSQVGFSGQEQYRSIWSDQGAEAFCDHFEVLIKD